MIVALTLFGSSSVFVTAADTNAPASKTMVIAKRIILPEFKLDGVKFNDAILALSEEGRRFDPNHKGVNFLVSLGPDSKELPTITLDLKNVTLAEAANRLAQSAGIFVIAHDYAFVYRPKNNLGVVELVAGTTAKFDLGAGKWCKIVGTQRPNAIHLDVTLLVTNAPSTGYTIQSMSETTTLPGKECDILLEDTMVSITPTLKKP